MKLGKQLIRNEIIARDELRYAKLQFCFMLNPKPVTIGPWLNIPIPFMKKDHGLLVKCFKN